MKKLFTNPTTIIFLFFAVVLIASNICCTGRKSINNKIASTNVAGVITLTEDNFDKKIDSGIVLVDFWATWCPPCRMESPIIENISSEMLGKINVYKIDIDESPAIAVKFNVQSIPTLIIFKDGKLAEQFVGFTQKEDIIAAIIKISNNK